MDAVGCVVVFLTLRSISCVLLKHLSMSQSLTFLSVEFLKCKAGNFAANASFRLFSVMSYSVFACLCIIESMSKNTACFLFVAAAVCHQFFMTYCVRPSYVRRGCGML